MDPVEAFINNNTRSKSPSAKFKRIGDKVVGTINRANIVTTTDRTTHQPVENLVVELTLEHGVEDGQAMQPNAIISVWFKPGEMLRRLGDAMKEAGVKSVIPGDKLAVDFYNEEPSKQMSPKKLYRVAYKVVAPASTEVTAGDLI